MAIITNFNNLEASFNTKIKELVAIRDFIKSALNGAFSSKDFKDRKRVDLGSGIFALLQDYHLKLQKDAFFESHRKYIDFQVTIRGSEGFLFNNIEKFKAIKEYDESNDFIEYQAQEDVNFIHSVSGDVCVFFPYDAHAGGILTQGIFEKHASFFGIEEIFHSIDSKLEELLFLHSKEDVKFAHVEKIVIKTPLEIVKFKF